MDNTRDLLKQAVDNNDFQAFNRAYTQFLDQFSAFKKSYSKTPAEVQVTNAIFGEHGFYLKQTNDEQASRMLQAGRKASKVFGSLAPQERLEFLQMLEKNVTKYQDAIMLTITADTGKPMALSKGEMIKGNEWFEFAREEMEKQLSSKHQGRLTRSAKPLGVSQVIGAYNYPYALAIGGMVGSLAAGNGVIVSAPLKAPNWVFPFMQAAQETIEEFSQKAKADGKSWADAFAQDAQQLIQASVGVNRNLTANSDVVHFVGGDVTGEMIRKSRGTKRTILELGGSNVVAVMASAAPNDKEAEEIAKVIYSGFGPATGQRCTAPRMLCVQEGAEGVAEHLKQLCDEGPKPGEIGNPFQDGVKMGPLIDKVAHQKMEDAIVLAHELGASVHGQLRVGDNIVPQARSDGSFWVNPIVIDWSKADMSTPDHAKRVHDCLKSEIFGPLLHIVQRVNTLDEAINVTNTLDSHGLAGAIFTANEADVDKYQASTSITSLSVNGIPKDQSPRGEHGHPGFQKIGGDHHFSLYADNVVRATMR